MRDPCDARLSAHPNVFHPEQDRRIAPGVHLAEKLGDLPILGGNTVEILTDYDEILDRLVADIDAARSHVHLLFYIIADDPVAGRVMAALERAASARRRLPGAGRRAGVAQLGYERDAAALHAAGIEARQTMRIGFFRQRGARMDLRNHRKIAVIDGRIGVYGVAQPRRPDVQAGTRPTKS